MLTETLRRAAEREGIALPAGSENALVDHWHELPIFDDVGPALSPLRENGWSLAILSNCDDDLLATTLERMPVEFDLTVTAEQVGSYKPGHRPLARRSRERTEGERGRWVHAAHSWFHDIQHRVRARPPARVGRPARLRRGRLARERAAPEPRGPARRRRARNELTVSPPTLDFRPGPALTQLHPQLRYTAAVMHRTRSRMPRLRRISVVSVLGLLAIAAFASTADAAGLAVDQLVTVNQGTGSRTIVSPAFSTTASNELLLWRSSAPTARPRPARRRSRR